MRLQRTLLTPGFTLCALLALAPLPQAWGQRVRIPIPRVAKTPRKAAAQRPPKVRPDRSAALAERVQPLFPTGETFQSASLGFRNQGQFLTALHASRNLNIAFDQLKLKMTGAQNQSLARALRELRPDLSAATIKSDVAMAQTQARADRQR